MGTHYYAVDGAGALHVFHTQEGRSNWLGNQRGQDRRERAVERRDADRNAGRRAVARMTRQRHPMHFVLEAEQPPEQKGEPRICQDSK